MNSWLRLGIAASALTLAGSLQAVELETEEAKLGYIIGMDVGKSLRQQGTTVELDALFEAIRATYEGEETAMTDEEAVAIRQAYIAKRQEQAAAEQAAVATKNAVESQAFLAEKAAEEGVQVTESGLLYKVVSEGDGAKPELTDTVTVHYRGTLADGTEFDSSYSRDEPFTLGLNQVIPGWTEGLQLMPVGSKYMFYIKPELGYGAAGGGPIPPNSALVFEVELLEIQDQQ